MISQMTSTYMPQRMRSGKRSLQMSWSRLARLWMLLLLHALVPNSYGQHPSPPITPAVKHDPVTLDERWFAAINNWGKENPKLDLPMKALTYSLAPVGVAVPVGFYGYGWFEKDDQSAEAGLGIALGEIVSGGADVLLKNIIQRERPYYALNDVRPPTNGSAGYSFPSGHASESFALATGLSIYYPKWYVIAPSALYAVLVSLSRPYLGVHYPSDIFAGAVLGVGGALIGRELERMFRKQVPNIYPDPLTLTRGSSSIVTVTIHL